MGQRRGGGGVLARALGWFSVGLGTAQVVAPGAMGEFVGVRPTEGSRALMRLVGVRELLAGAGILGRARPAGWLRARVAGDVIDLALLRAALGSGDSRQPRVAGATAAVAGVTLLDLIASARLGRAPNERGVRGTAAITINRPPDEVYRSWRDVENLPRFMAHLESVRATGDGRSHWVARAPLGTSVEWDAEVVEDVPGERIAWRSVGGAVENSGSVRFAPAPRGQGTEVTVELDYRPPGGRVGAAFAKLFGEEPEQQMRDDLRRFKQVIETGEVVRSEGSPDGTRTQRQVRQREAQPLAGMGER